MTCTPDSGTAPGQVNVAVDTSGLGVGVYDTEITIESPEGANSPVVVNVTLEVTEEPTNRPPPAPRLIGPEDGSDVKGENPSLVVGNVEDPDGDAVSYDFEIYIMGEGDPLATISDVAEGDTTTTVQLGGMEIGQTYQWRARAVDEKDLAGDWSEMWAFTVIEKGGGCGCGTTSEGGPGFVFLLLALYGWAWRSKQRRQ
jgi:MYXO-CTERM domain-containing protein